jgi:Zn-dependent protease
MNWAIQIGILGQTRLRLHLSFLLLLLWTGFSSWKEQGALAAFHAVFFTCLIFFCVLLHELGHVFAARRYGIPTPQITLLPFGGVAQMDRLPEKPGQEIAVALAGPAVNLGIGAALWTGLIFTGGMPDPAAIELGLPLSLPVRLLSLNLWLALFNLLPAFPMDGGRVLRALLALRLPHLRATQMAARIGQGLALGLGLLGLLSSPLLVFLAAFLFLSAGAELGAATLRHLARDARVSAAMLAPCIRLPLECTLQDAVESLLHSAQNDFPVTDAGGHLRGLLTREGIVCGLGEGGQNPLVTQWMRRTVPTVEPSMSVEKALGLLRESGSTALPVLDESGEVLGLFTPENATQFLRVRNALQNHSKNGHTG